LAVKKKKRKLANFKLPPELLDELASRSKSTGKTKTSIVETALKRYLKVR
jgi:predicted DNA-binding protein